MKAKVSFKQLQALEAVARHGSFTLAAKELGVSQPTVSSLIYTLERQFDCRLLDRGGSGITPTKQLTEVSGHIKTVLAPSDTISQHLMHGSNLMTGRFRIGYCTYQIAMPVIADFVRNYPDLDVNASSGVAENLFQQLRDGTLNVAFVAAPDAPKDFDATHLYATRVGLALPTDHPLAKQDELHWDQLEGISLVQRAKGSGLQHLFDHAANTSGTKIIRGLRFNSWGSTTAMVRQGGGFAVALEPECAEEPGIRFVPIAGLTLNHYLICQQALRDTAPVQRFREVADARHRATSPCPESQTPVTV